MSSPYTYRSHVPPPKKKSLQLILGGGRIKDEEWGGGLKKEILTRLKFFLGNRTEFPFYEKVIKKDFVKKQRHIFIYGRLS